jgi:hypothetical protein
MKAGITGRDVGREEWERSVLRGRRVTGKRARPETCGRRPFRNWGSRVGVERQKFPLRPQFGLYGTLKSPSAAVSDRVAALRVVSLLLG